MVTRDLYHGDRLKLNCHRTFALEMSPRGGADPTRMLEAKEGTDVVVTEFCGPHTQQVTFHFAEGPHREGPSFREARCYFNEGGAGAAG